MHVNDWEFWNFQNDDVTAKAVELTASLVEVQQIIATLVQQPEDFDRAIGQLVQNLTGSIQDEDTLVTVVKELISEVGFQMLSLPVKFDNSWTGCYEY